MYRVGFCLVLCPCPCDVLVMYQPRTPPLAPSESTLVINAKVDRIVVDQFKFLQQCAEPGDGLGGMDGRYVFGFGSRERDSGLLLRTPGEASAVEHKGKSGNRFSGIRVVRKVGIAVGSDLRVTGRSKGELVVRCASKVMQDSFDGNAVSQFRVRHVLGDLLNSMRDVGASHHSSVHE